MNIAFMNWNVAGALSEEAKARQLIHEISLREPDVAIFPEAYNEGQEQFLDDAQAELSGGYKVSLTAYDDDDNRQDRRGMMALVRHELSMYETGGNVVRLAGRNALEHLITSPESGQEVHVLGVHLNDRSGVKRGQEVDDLLDYLMLPTEPTVVHGDMNEVHFGSSRGLYFKVAGMIASSPKWLFPVGEPESVNPKMSRARIGSMAERLHEMSQGAVLQRLVDAGLRDADVLHQPTFNSKKPFAQLDHTLVSKSLIFKVKSFEVLPHHALSDHRATIMRTNL